MRVAVDGTAFPPPVTSRGKNRELRDARGVCFVVVIVVVVNEGGRSHSPPARGPGKWAEGRRLRT